MNTVQSADRTTFSVTPALQASSRSRVVYSSLGSLFGISAEVVASGLLTIGSIPLLASSNVHRLATNVISKGPNPTDTKYCVISGGISFGWIDQSRTNGVVLTSSSIIYVVSSGASGDYVSAGTEGCSTSDGYGFGARGLPSWQLLQNFFRRTRLKFLSRILMLHFEQIVLPQFHHMFFLQKVLNFRPQSAQWVSLFSRNSHGTSALFYQAILDQIIVIKSLNKKLNFKAGEKMGRQ